MRKTNQLSNNVTGWPKILLTTLSKDKVNTFLVIIVCTLICPIIMSCFLYASMICIKKRKFSNKIDATTKTLEANVESMVRVCSHPNSVNEENDVPNQERSNNIECQSNVQTNSNETSVADFIQEQSNSVEDQEVI